MIVERNGDWLVTLAPSNLNDKWEEHPLASFTQNIGRHLLIDGVAAKLGVPQRGLKIDTADWRRIQGAIQSQLEASDGFRLRVQYLIDELKKRSDLDQDIVEDVAKMCATMGITKTTKDKGGIWYALSDLNARAVRRRRYLSSFAEDLLSNSRRIDDLIQHTGTVGSYREDLVRNLLRKILPARYEVSTGFIENSARQLDVIIWDAHRYGALFREGHLVVVPMPSVRAIIEVKTTLSTGPLDEALEILSDVLRMEQPPLPIFRGIFAFTSEYASDQSVADRMKVFYNTTVTDGHSRMHSYLGQGVTAVCVPHQHYVFQSFVNDPNPKEFPVPKLFGVEPDGSSDIATALFLSELFTYLDIDVDAKTEHLRIMSPVAMGLKPRLLATIYDAWRPTSARASLGATLDVDAARSYVDAFAEFEIGNIDSQELAAMIASLNTRRSAPET